VPAKSEFPGTDTTRERTKVAQIERRGEGKERSSKAL
jgi:hypothetical protein